MRAARRAKHRDIEHARWSHVVAVAIVKRALHPDKASDAYFDRYLIGESVHGQIDESHTQAGVRGAVDISAQS